MTPVANPERYKNHRFPPEIISRAVWLYFRFTLSYRDVEEMMFARGSIFCCRAGEIKRRPRSFSADEISSNKLTKPTMSTERESQRLLLTMLPCLEG